MLAGSKAGKRPAGLVQCTSAALASLPGHSPRTAMAAPDFLNSFRGTSPGRGLPISMCGWAMPASGKGRWSGGDGRWRQGTAGVPARWRAGGA